MIKFQLFLIVLTISFFKQGEQNIYAQNHPNGVDFLIENIKYPDFTFAGVPGGIPLDDPGAIYDVNDYSGTDREKIQSAVDDAIAAGGGIIYLPTDTYYLDDYVLITGDNIVIRGDGRNKTVVILQGSSENNHNHGAFTFKGEGTSFESHRIIEDVEKGDRLIVLDNDYGYQPGDFFLMRVHNDDLINSKPFYRKKFILYRENQPYDFMHEVIYQVDTAYGNKLVLTQPIRISFPKSPPEAVEKGSAYFTHIRPAKVIRNCGVENLRVETEKFASTMFTSGVAFTFAYACWIKNLYIYQTGSLPFQFHDAKNVEVRDCIFDQSWNTGGGGNGYCVFWRTHDGLMENVTTFSLRHAPNLQSFAGGCVVRNSEFYNNDAQWHGRWTHENLYENIHVVCDENDDAYYFLLSNELNDNIPSHEPHLHGNVLYNSEFEMQRSGIPGAILGGLYKDWVFAYNKFQIRSSSAIINLGDWCDGVDFHGNNFGIVNYSGHGAEYAFRFTSGFDTSSLGYDKNPSHNKNIRITNNNFYNLPDERKFRTTYFNPTLVKNNVTFPNESEVPRPEPLIPSIYEFEKMFKNSSPEIEILNPLPGSEFNLGDEVPVELQISDTQGYGDPLKVEFYFDTSLITTTTSPPFSITWKSDSHSRDKHKKLIVKVIYLTDTFTRYNKIKIAPPTFNLSVSAENGTIKTTPERSVYFMNDKVTLSAEGDLGWSFESWSGDLSHSLNPVTVNIDSNMVIEGNFIPVDTFRLFTYSDNGGIKPSPESGIYNAGEEVSLEAIPFQGYKFSKWEGDNSGSSNPDTILMDTVKNIHAHFVFDPTSNRGAEIDYTDPVGSGIITARSEQNDLEGMEKAFDNLYVSSNWSKWLDNAGIPTSTNPSWIQINMPWEVAPHKLAIVSANDVPGRDPKNFKLKGSNSLNPDWEMAEVLSSWNDVTFSSRFQYKEFTFENNNRYSKFRLEITANKESMALTQLAEILILGPSGFQYLEVKEGTGTGYYPVDWNVEIIANVPSGYDFHQWNGDTEYVEAIDQSPTFLKIPANDVAITATFVPTLIDKKKAGKINIYPNPFTRVLNLDLSNIPAGKGVKITLYNIIGELVFSEELQGGNKHSIDLKNTPPGVYLLKHSWENKIVTLRITKVDL